MSCKDELGLWGISFGHKDAFFEGGVRLLLHHACAKLSFPIVHQEPERGHQTNLIVIFNNNTTVISATKSGMVACTIALHNRMQRAQGFVASLLFCVTNSVVFFFFFTCTH